MYNNLTHAFNNVLPNQLMNTTTHVFFCLLVNVTTYHWMDMCKIILQRQSILINSNYITYVAYWMIDNIHSYSYWEKKNTCYYTRRKKNVLI